MTLSETSASPKFSSVTLNFETLCYREFSPLFHSLYNNSYFYRGENIVRKNAGLSTLLSSSATKSHAKIFFLTYLFFAAGLTLGFGQNIKTVSQKREQEKLITATLVLGAMNISVESSHSENAFEYKFTSSDTSLIDCNYLLHANSVEEISVGQLKMKQKSKSIDENFSLSSFFRSGSSSDDMQSLRLSLTDALPIDLDLTFGGASAELNLTGLQLRRLGLNSGACQTKILFKKPNKEKLESFKVSAGASSVVLSGIGNANIENFNYTGGASNAVIDFSGELMRNLIAKISVGAGSATVYVPKNVNVIVRYEENFFSSVKLPEDFEAEEDYFTSCNQNPKAHTIELHLSSGVGSVKVQWK